MRPPKTGGDKAKQPSKKDKKAEAEEKKKEAEAKKKEKAETGGAVCLWCHANIPIEFIRLKCKTESIQRYQVVFLDALGQAKTARNERRNKVKRDKRAAETEEEAT